MDFLFVKPFKGNRGVDLKPIFLCRDQVVRYGSGYYVAFRPNVKKILAPNSGIILSGQIFYKNRKQNESLKNLFSNVIEGRWPIGNDFDGIFSGIAFNEDKIYIFNDPIGPFRLYYYIDKVMVAVSTNLTSMRGVIQTPLNHSSLVLEIANPEFSQYGKLTVLKNVYSLLPGECVIIDRKGEISRTFDCTIKAEDKDPNPDFIQEIKYNLEESLFFLGGEERFYCSMSGGIDSRVNLASAMRFRDKIHLINFGKKDWVDSSIPVKISQHFGLNIDVIDPIPFIFPEKDFAYKIVRETDSLYINTWLSLFSNFHQSTIKYPTILLGDMCDLLRGKGLRSLMSRSFRKKYYLKRFFRKEVEIPYTPLTDEVKHEFKMKVIGKVLREAKLAFEKFQFENVCWKDISYGVQDDVLTLLNHIDMYNCNSLESYEELFGIFSHGRRSMSKQLNILKYAFSPWIPVMSMKLARLLLNVSVRHRFGDNLTHEMFCGYKTDTWSKLGNFPTAQNPFVPYKSPYYLMLLGWFARSSIDQFLLRIYVRSKGKSRRQRLFKSFDHVLPYLHSGALKNYKSCLSKRLKQENLVNKFQGRQNRMLWPLSSQDLVPYIQASYYIDNFC